MGLRIGTSGWNYPTGKGTWNGIFYPAGRSKRAGIDRFDELRFYAAHFDTVEVNNTFYRLPNLTTLEGWAAQVPEGVSFVLKPSKRITHDKRLADVADSVGVVPPAMIKRPPAAPTAA